MRKFITALLLAALMVGGAGSASAAQNNPGSCTLSGGTVQINVKEQPGEGEVDYVSLASPVRLNVLADVADPTRASIYGSAGLIFSRGAYSSPVDGDGYWNYRIDIDYTTGGHSELQVEHVYVRPEKYDSTNYCTTNIYI